MSGKMNYSRGAWRGKRSEQIAPGRSFANLTPDDEIANWKRFHRSKPGHRIPLNSPIGREIAARYAKP